MRELPKPAEATQFVAGKSEQTVLTLEQNRGMENHETVVYTIDMAKDQTPDDIAMRRADLDITGVTKPRFTDRKFRRIDKQIRKEVAAMIAKDREKNAASKLSNVREQLEVLTTPDNVSPIERTPSDPAPLARVAGGEE